MKKKVYICAPLGGDVQGNIERVKRYARYALLCGMAPVVPHFYALCLDDNDPRERQLGLDAGMSILWFCDELWVCGDRISKGMQAEIEFCRIMHIPIVQIPESKIQDIKEVKQDE